MNKSINIPEIRKKIELETLTDFDFQEVLKFYAEHIELLTVGEEMMIKECIRKCYTFLDISPRDVNDVFKSYLADKG
jgi:hypothetical protein